MITGVVLGRASGLIVICVQRVANAPASPPLAVSGGEVHSIAISCVSSSILMSVTAFFGFFGGGPGICWKVRFGLSTIRWRASGLMVCCASSFSGNDSVIDSMLAASGCAMPLVPNALNCWIVIGGLAGLSAYGYVVVLMPGTLS